MAESRKLAAILATDVVGYSRLTTSDEDRKLARLRALRSDLIDPTIAVHDGRVVKRTGDGALVEFRSVVDRFDGSTDDVFELQDKVALSVAGVIEPALQEAEIRRSTARSTSDLTAYDLYLRALPLMRGGGKEPALQGVDLLRGPSHTIPTTAARSSARRGAPANLSQVAGPRIPRPSGEKRSLSLGERSRRPLTIPRCSYGLPVLSISSERISVARSRCSITRLPSIRATPSVGSGAVS